MYEVIFLKFGRVSNPESTQGKDYIGTRAGGTAGLSGQPEQNEGHWAELSGPGQLLLCI